MKTSNKSSIFTGVVLLIIAALFTISLLFQPLNAGMRPQGINYFFFVLGDMLFSFYGFSSILIPVFLLTSGLSCFATKWTARKTLRFLTAIIPFFTAVITENICRSILAFGNTGFTPLVITVAIITGVMLIVIEFLGIGIIADKINNKSHVKETLNSEQNENGTQISQAQQSELVGVKDSKLNRINVPEELNAANNSQSNSNDETVVSNQDDINFYEEIDGEDITVIENDALTIDETSVSEQQPEEVIQLIDEIKQYAINPNSENVQNNQNNQQNENENQNENKNENQNQDVAKTEEKLLENEVSNPATMITQEEYAALTVQNDVEPEPDELVWPDLPPVPDKLPPEYDEDAQIEEVDENDPALQFPPIDDSENVSNTEYSEEIAEPDVDVNDETEEKSDDTEETGTIEMPEFSEVSENTENSESESENSSSDETEKTEENGETAESLSDFFSQVKPSSFSKVIEIKKEASEENKPALRSENVVSEYPATISLDENTSTNLPSAQNVKKVPQQEKNTAYGNKPVPENNERKTVENKSAYPKKISIRDELAMHGNNTPRVAARPLNSAVPSSSAANTLNATASSKVISVKPSVSNAFSDMEREIRLAHGLSVDETENQILENESDENEVSEDFSINAGNAGGENTDFAQSETEFPEEIISEEIENDEDDFSEEVKVYESFNKEDDDDDEIDENFEPEFIGTIENSEFEDEEMEESVFDETENIPAEANNLTADNLTDFFVAQQEENTPKTKEIAANPPKFGNRAVKKGPYIIPSDLLTAYKDDQYWIIDDSTKEASLRLKQTLAEFRIEAEIIGIKKGPVVTMFEILPAPGVKLQRIVSLQDNIALSLAAQSVRIVAPIPGKQAVGIEVPNKNRSVVGFREIIEMDLPEWKKMSVPVILGKDILGKAQLIDLVKTPHMLIAGATGSGKSVCVNSLILSILYKRSFNDVKLILVDPKVVELKLYNDIPHLLTPVITEPKKALQALQWCLCEMERRYALLDGMGVRDIANYNQKIKEQKICTEKLPYIVVIIDEFADLMATSGKELETIVARLTAMSRAVGIHLVLATQRPSVNVITGLIKANIPTRIAFMVASRTDSNIIIDTVGAEKLLGRGDMLYASAVDPAPIRIQGTFVSDQEVENVVTAVKDYGEPDYLDEEIFTEEDDEETARDLFGDPVDDDDPLYDQALEIVVQAGKASASYIQRRLKIGYNRAARLVEEMEERGIVGPANGSKPREVIHIP